MDLDAAVAAIAEPLAAAVARRLEPVIREALADPSGLAGTAVQAERTWLTTAGVAERAQRSINTVRLAVVSGDLHGHQPVRAGRQLRKGAWLVHLAAVDAWVCGLDPRTQAQRCGCVAVTAAALAPSTS